jgi:cholesterol transport system auxiliary component
MKMKYAQGGIIALIVMLGGCSMKEAPPLKRFTLDAGKISAAASCTYCDQVLKVSYPRTLKEKMTNRMQFSYSSSERGVYQNSEWFDTLPKLLQGTTIAALEQSGLFKAVFPSASSADETLRLESMIYDFSHHIRGASSYAVVSVQFSLIDTKTGRLVKVKRFSYREATPELNAKGYVTAANRAVNRLENDLIVWLKKR